MISAARIFVLGIALVLCGLIYAGVELANNIRPMELWVYHGPFGGVLVAFGILMVAFAYRPGLFDNLPFAKRDPLPPVVDRQGPPIGSTAPDSSKNGGAPNV